MEKNRKETYASIKEVKNIYNEEVSYEEEEITVFVTIVLNDAKGEHVTLEYKMNRSTHSDAYIVWDGIIVDRLVDGKWRYPISGIIDYSACCNIC